jgi:hypothetical protein
MGMKEIKNILLIEDIDGLIELGAPVDEYDDEANDIYDAMNENGSENLLEKIYSIWATSFALDEEELEKRKLALGKIHRLILSF